MSIKQRIFRALALLSLGVAVGTAYVATTPLPLPRNRFTTPVWIGPVQVVDVVAGTVHANRAVRIAGSWIAEIVPADGLDPALRSQLVGVGGAHVVPGLWDMHALALRYAPSLDFPLHLAHGVTRLRNIASCGREGAVALASCQADRSRWAAAVGSGEMLGPVTMGSGSHPINGPGWRPRGTPEAFDAATAEEAREMVRLIAAHPHRTDHLKTYDDLPRKSYFALVDEATRLGIEVSGHVPIAVSVREAAAAGHKAIAHARVLPLACSSREADVQALRSRKAPQAEWMRLALDHYDAEVCRSLWAELVQKGTYVSPTLITRYNETLEGITALRRDPDVAPYTPRWVDLIQWEDISAIEGRPAATEEVFQRFYDEAARLTAEAERAGVRLLLGTDTYDLLVVPGVGLHQEMALWRKAGIPPAALLRAATTNAVAYFGLEGTHGQVKPGHVADLVFVRGNPLDDLGVLRRPAAVMQDGRLYDRADLDAMLAHAREVASGARLTVHFLRDLLRNPMGFVR